MEKYKVIPVTVDKTKEEKKPTIIAALENTYVIDGDDDVGSNMLRDKNFSDSSVLELKGDSKNGRLQRKILLKFDISALDGKKEKNISLRLFGTVMQDEYIHATTKLYITEIDADAWNEADVTFDTVPQKGEAVACRNVGKNFNYIDITEYIKKKIAEGKKVVSLLLEGDSEKPIRISFASTRSKINGPELVAVYGDNAFATNIATNDKVEDVWEIAAKRVEEWSKDWAEALARGDANAEFVYEKPEEYSKQVAMGRSPKRPLVDRPTRTMDSIIGYEPVKEGEIKLDEYGGYICDKKFEATGWFHVEEKYGRLWTVTPLGNPFFRKAMVSISAGSEGRQRDAVVKKCGTMENWAKHETEFLRDDLGYNSLGGWCDIDRLSQVENPLALSHIIGFVSVYARINGMNNTTGGNTTFVGGVMPVFDPAFVDFSDARAKEAVAPYVNDPHLYGWMGDNELHAELRMLDAHLLADIENPWFAYSYATAWTFLRTVTGKEDVSLFDVTDEHRKLFRAMVYNRYFRVIVSAIKKYDPNHMFIGSRFLPGCYRDEYVHRISGKWCDVISMNYYGAWEPESELMQNIQKWSGTPFIITEWYAKGMDACTPETRLTNESGAGFTVPTQKDRGYFYHNYTLKLMECKGCAGFDWFKAWDNDPDNLKADLSNRNSNKGIYTSDYEVYTDLADAMREVNNNCYKLIDFFDADKTRSN